MQTEPKIIISPKGLEAWRSMGRASNVPLLISGDHFVWEPHKTVVSMSNRCSGDTPGHLPTADGDCTCGIYSFKEQIDVFRNGYIVYGEGVAILTKLWVSGKVVRFSQGYRSQYATIAEIHVLYFDVEWEAKAIELAASLEGSYGVPVIPRMLSVAEREISKPTYPPTFNLRPVRPGPLTFEELLKAHEDQTLAPHLKAFVKTQLKMRLKSRISRIAKRLEGLQLSIERSQKEVDADLALWQQLFGHEKIP